MKFILFGGKGERYKFGSPMNEVLPLGRIPDCFWGPDHTRCGVFDGDESLVGPVDQVGAFPDENASGAGSLGRIPGCLVCCQSVEALASWCPICWNILSQCEGQCR